MYEYKTQVVSVYDGVATADGVYFKTSEYGEWTFLVKNLRGYDDI